MKEEKLNNKPNNKGRKVFTKRRILFFLFLILTGIAIFLGWKLRQQKNDDDRQKKVIREIKDEKKKKGVKKLHKKYKDMIGWVEIKGTDFSYPIMKTGIKGHQEKDWQYYLHRDVHGKYSFYGTPFLDVRCTPDSDNLIILLADFYYKKGLLGLKIQRKSLERRNKTMVEQLEIVKPRSQGIQWKDCKKKWKKIYQRAMVFVAGMYFKVLTSAPVIAYAAKKETDSKTDTGVADVTDGINVIKDLVLGCVGGVGVIFLAWGLLDFGTAYAAHQTSEQSQAIKKVIGGLIMVFVEIVVTYILI